MSITNPPFILSGVQQQTTSKAKRTIGQKNDNSAFTTIVGQNPETVKDPKIVPQNQQTSKNQQSAHVISQLFANGLGMGETQHQQNEMIMQNVIQSSNKGTTLDSKGGLPLDRTPSGIAIQQSSGKGIPLDIKRDIIFSSYNIALNSKVKIENDLTMGERIGQLAARFESGSKGVAAIGYDQVGGTSYGKYQIASKPGSMDQFIKFLEKEDPDIAKRLKSAGPTDTGSRSGTMPEVWQDIAEKQPKKFEELQERFISESHYKPTVNVLNDAGFNTDKFSSAMKEVLWSTSVQHGPSAAVRIFNQAVDKAGVSPDSEFNTEVEQNIIQNIYDVRRSQFGSSTETVKLAVDNRMNNERDMALAMLHSNSNVG